MKVPSVYTDLCFKQFCENATAGRNSTLLLSCEQLKLRAAASADCSCSNWCKVT